MKLLIIGAFLVGIIVGILIMCIWCNTDDPKEYERGYKDGSDMERALWYTKESTIKKLLIKLNKTGGTSLMDDIACRHCNRRVGGECPLSEEQIEDCECPMPDDEVATLFIKYGLEEIK